MDVYKAMYLKIFNAVTGAITLLQEAQRETEKMYIDSGDVPLIPESDKNNKDSE